VVFKVIGKENFSIKPDFIAPRVDAGSLVKDINGQNILDEAVGIEVEVL
jgi:hypothetical protein